MTRFLFKKEKLYFSLLPPPEIGLRRIATMFSLLSSSNMILLANQHVTLCFGADVAPWMKFGVRWGKVMQVAKVLAVINKVF